MLLPAFDKQYYPWLFLKLYFPYFESVNLHYNDCGYNALPTIDGFHTLSHLEEEVHFDLTIEAKEYQILKIISIVGEHKDAADFITELSNGYYISGGIDNILKIYNKDFIQIKELKDIEGLLSFCFERKKSPHYNDYDIELIACFYKKLYQIFLSFKDEIKYRYQKII